MSSSSEQSVSQPPAPRPRKSAVPKVVAVLIVVVIVLGAGLYVFRGNLFPSSNTSQTLVIGSSATVASFDPAVAFDTGS
ncbi:MAG: hypothetical protein JRN15_15240, partial [Nitrososphaerota archaeon]|nr:hypothetical protein [Nitrososphaerota archaeon]